MPVSVGTYYFLHEGSKEGQKPPVVLLHGAGGSNLFWPPEIRRLPGYRVYAPDLPGHGKSGGSGFQSISEYVISILDWLEAIGLHSAVFVGFSMGSAIALSLALDYPDQVKGLGLIGAGARLRVAADILRSASSQTTFENGVHNVVEASFSSSTPNQLKMLTEKRMKEIRQSVFLGDLIACDQFDVLERIASIHQPTVVISGSEDRLTPLKYSQFLADHIPGATLESISRAGHMVTLERPELVASILRGFLDRINY